MKGGFFPFDFHFDSWCDFHFDSWCCCWLLHLLCWLLDSGFHCFHRIHRCRFHCVLGLHCFHRLHRFPHGARAKTNRRQRRSQTPKKSFFCLSQNVYGECTGAWNLAAIVIAGANAARMSTLCIFLDSHATAASHKSWLLTLSSHTLIHTMDSMIVHR